MAILTIIENWKGDFKKTSFECVQYGKEIASQVNKELITISFGSNVPEKLKEYGADKIINFSNLELEKLSNEIIASIVNGICTEYNIETVVLANTITGKSIGPLLAHKLNAGLITNAIEHPKSQKPLTVVTKGFSSKAYVTYTSDYTKNIIAFLPNAIG